MLTLSCCVHLQPGFNANNWQFFSQLTFGHGALVLETGADIVHSGISFTSIPSRGSVTPGCWSETFKVCGDHGLLPRPEESHILSRPLSSGPINPGVHFDQVPFIVRRAGPQDAATLHHLQSFLQPTKLRRYLPLKHLQCVLEAHASKHWVAEAGDRLLAAVVFVPHENGSPGAMQFELLAVHPALEERAEVLFALVLFAFQCLADQEVTAVHQGNVRVLLGNFDSPMVTFKSQQGEWNPNDIKSNAMQEERRPRKVVFSEGVSLESIVAAISEGADVLHLPLLPILSASASPELDHEEMLDGIDALASLPKANSILEEARRITATLDFYGAGKLTVYHLICVKNWHLPYSDASDCLLCRG